MDFSDIFICLMVIGSEHSCVVIIIVFIRLCGYTSMLDGYVVINWEFSGSVVIDQL